MSHFDLRCGRLETVGLHFFLLSLDNTAQLYFFYFSFNSLNSYVSHNVLYLDIFSFSFIWEAYLLLLTAFEILIFFAKFLSLFFIFSIKLEAVRELQESRVRHNGLNALECALGKELAAEFAAMDDDPFRQRGGGMLCLSEGRQAQM